MKYQIDTKLNYFDEALTLVTNIANDNEGIYPAILNINSVKSDSQKSKIINDIIKIKNEVKLKYGEKITELSRYFLMVKDSELSVAQLILNCNEVNQDSSKQLISNAKRLGIQQRINNYYDQIENSDSTLTDSSDKMMKQLINLLDELHIAETIKWTLIESIYDPEPLIDKLVMLLTDIEKVLLNHQTFLLATFTYGLDYLQAIDKSTDLLELFKNEASLSLELSEKIVIRPSIFNPYQIAANLNQVHGLNIAIGCVFDFCDLKKNRLSKIDDIVVFGKIIQDESKLKIIQALKTKDMYGKELAETLGLTTATISYHMSALFQSGLVYIDVRAKRTYYKLNRDKLQNNLANIKAILLD